MPPTTRFVLREQESALRPELDIAATRADVSLGPISAYQVSGLSVQKQFVSGLNICEHQRNIL